MLIREEINNIDEEISKKEKNIENYKTKIKSNILGKI